MIRLRMKKVLSLFLLMTILTGVVQYSGTAVASAAKSDFTIVRGVLTKYNGSAPTVTIPNTVTAIGDYAFKEHTEMTAVKIPNTVTSIGKYAFQECSSLKKIVIPDSVESIGIYAFDQCRDLKKVTLSNKLTSIGVHTFSECESLMQITIPDDVTSIGNYAFSDCTELKDITISSSVKSVGKYAFDGCSGLTINGYTDSYIQTYAEKNKIPFKSIGNGTLTLDTRSLVFAPRSTYTIGANLVGSNVYVRAASNNGKVVKVTKISNKTFQLTALKAGKSDIVFTVYKKNKPIASTSVKVEAKFKAETRGNSSRKTIKF
ncbi:leucine-rich repeat domain-containing protein [Caproiciproducens galactitolivorans]|uniref:Leucine-rich repeat domain-containing protein n=1 Tax=Caproiciproducens galactitolivorans TaxID=642589 RepID=A0A4Z0Y7L0_9FIRM|nr:leucine-rich repeat domain-containing protein [Caproiciproducens galactitolivorans]TGJ75938.1 hypothetical protein CAGA_19130 [Caproiciproducens galactitolivorans]